ncbi:hypothetical protein JTE90_005241 [Oedothorax gibbosus]|uniref:Uncharacterized protein n=1 Tax=Oedothorax gibbosus TaxID=931172 RepID=A0AAV6TDF4_9ARAC|nr:hypothetical protein JTE90_005241 [Oedothorax gibbosus]
MKKLNHGLVGFVELAATRESGLTATVISLVEAIKLPSLAYAEFTQTDTSPGFNSSLRRYEITRPVALVNRVDVVRRYPKHSKSNHEPTSPATMGDFEER